ncbi:MAG: hypothetical protein QOD13_3492 [Thermoleophilaceae bacterium]|jgi:DNA-binding IclR family transcriptional regulator|nr:hypothetical protein [Thermoleophilaceae bacterium]
MTEISKTADQALALLVCIADRGPASATELAGTLGINRTVVHRLLATLRSRGFIRKDGNNYVPGAVIVRIAQDVEPALRSAGQPVLQQLADAVQETTLLEIRDQREAVVLDQVVAGRHLVSVRRQIGERHPLHLAASGRAMLAFSRKRVVDRCVAGLPDADDVRRKLAEVKEAGYEISHDELLEGVHGIAAPIQDESGQAVGSMSVVVPMNRAPQLNDHIAALVRAARTVTERLAEVQPTVAGSGSASVDLGA